MSESYVQAWEDELPEHPVVAELRAQPGRWAVISHRDQHGHDAWLACRWHPNVQVYSRGLDGMSPMLRKARWLPDPVMAAVTILKGSGLDA